jgi:hypothetical protein
MRVILEKCLILAIRNLKHLRAGAPPIPIYNIKGLRLGGMLDFTAIFTCVVIYFGVFKREGGGMWWKAGVCYEIGVWSSGCVCYSKMSIP